MAAVKRKHGAVHDVDLDADALQELAQAFLAVYREHTGAGAARTIRTSSSSARSRRYSSRGTASARSTTGGSSGSRRPWPTARRSTSARWCSATWATTRPPASASPAIRPPARTSIYGEYLVNAQGEDVVAGIRTPKPIAAMAQEMPALYRQLLALRGEARGPLQGGAGLRVHDRARPALLPADAQRQDERAGDGDDVGRDVRGGPDLQGPGARPHQRACCSSSCSCPRSTRPTRPTAGPGPAGVARRRVGQHRVRRGHRGTARPRGRRA